MNNLLVQIYQSAAAKYIKFRKRLDKNISSGRFGRFTRRKQSQLVHKVNRLRRRVLELQAQLKLATAGAALGLLLSTAPVKAQSTLGPFEHNLIGNPLPPPLPYINKSVPIYVDLDKDGDLDLVVGNYNYGLQYFKNLGSSTDPFFSEIYWYESEYPFSEVMSNIPSNRDSWVPAFADIDNDGDVDLLVGVDKYLIGGETWFFRNTGTATSPVFSYEFGGTNPFDGFQTGSFAHPTFGDLDKDGDVDLILAGYYDRSTANYLIKYYQNTGTISSPNFVLNTTHSLVGSVNNIYDASSAPGAFADLDKDGDLDFFFGIYGRIIYLRNDAGSFSSEFQKPNQTGPWTPNAANPGNSLGNPFHLINQDTPDFFNNYSSIAFADLDKDGDLDVTLGYHIYSNYYNERTLVYFENTGLGVLQRRDGLASPLDGIDLGDTSNASFSDIDQDGDLDIVISGSTVVTECNDGCGTVVNNYITVIRNDDGVLTDITGTTGDQFSDLPINDDARVLLVDVMGDGDEFLDLVVPYHEFSNYGYITESQVQFFENVNGNYVERIGSENPFSSFTLEGYKASLDLGDLDDDGLPDLILGTGNDPLKAFRNTGTAGNPVFTSHPAWEGGFDEFHYVNSTPRLLDLDSDGDLDIIVGKYDNVWYYENVGSAEVPLFVEYSESDDENPFGDVGDNKPVPSFFDVDRDGDLDLIAGNQYGQFVYYENTNPPPVTTLAETLTLPEQTTPIILDPTITVSDADGDLIARAVISIQDFRPEDESLSFTPQGDITGEFDDETGILTLTGLGTTTEYANVLKTVSYQFTGAKPTVSGRRASPGGRTSSTEAITLDRVITFSVFDIDRTDPAPTVLTLQISFGAESIIVYNGISPNGDALNSFMLIENIEVLEPKNKVTIFNRWGDKVAEVIDYNNTTRRFDGVSKNGGDLASGVYFYKIEFFSGRETLSGYVTIKK